MRYRGSSVPCPDSRTSLPFAVAGGVAKGSDTMRKSLKRVLDLLREKTGAAFREKTAVRGGLQEPQRLQAIPAPVRRRS